GHDAGDEVLRQVVQLLVGQSGRSTVIARYGGDEFVALLPRTPKAAAIRDAERLRAIIARYPFTNGPVTASFGVACFPDDTEKQATPKLAVTGPFVNGYRAMIARKRSASRIAAAFGVRGSRATNSSPPYRAMTVERPDCPTRSWTTCRRTSSPASWPQRSFTLLNWSRSSRMSESGWLPLAERSTSS